MTVACDLVTLRISTFSKNQMFTSLNSLAYLTVNIIPVGPNNAATARILFNPAVIPI